MNAGTIGAFIPIVAIVGGLAVAIFSMLARARVRELEIRERIAMIEKGLVPPPEVDPAGFDRAMSRCDRRRSASGRRVRGGIIVMGVGFGLMFMISMAGGTPREGIGVGGFLVIVGLAFLVSNLFDRPNGDSLSRRPGGTPSADMGGQTPTSR